MKRVAAASFLIFAASLQLAAAESCEEKFARLEIDGNGEGTPVRITITQEGPDGKVTKNYHYSDANGDGMSEMIDPADMPWSLFIGNDMYMSTDKGKSWSHMNSWDKEKSTADRKAAMRQDMAAATAITCGTDALDGVEYDTVEGSYKSSMLQGSKIWSKFWVSQDDGTIVRKDGISYSAAGEYKSTQIIEPWPDFVLPTPE